MRTQEDTSETRARARDLRMAGRFAELDRRSAVQTARWHRPQDILED